VELEATDAGGADDCDEPLEAEALNEAPQTHRHRSETSAITCSVSADASKPFSAMSSTDCCWTCHSVRPV